MFVKYDDPNYNWVLGAGYGILALILAVLYVFNGGGILGYFLVVLMAGLLALDIVLGLKSYRDTHTQR